MPRHVYHHQDGISVAPSLSATEPQRPHPSLLEAPLAAPQRGAASSAARASSEPSPATRAAIASSEPAAGPAAARPRRTGTRHESVGTAARAYHRIREVRLQQGVSLRTAARHMDSDVRTLRKQEREDCDIRLSDLQKWQKALEVPIADLLEEGEAPLSRPVMERARMIRLMKTAAAILEQSGSVGIERLARMMIDQLVEVMPELEEVSSWHTYGQRRGLDDYGRVVERTIPDSCVYDGRED